MNCNNYSRPDSIICKICEPSVKEKPGGSSARKRSARSARASAKYAPTDEEAGVGDTADDTTSNTESTEDAVSLQTEVEDVPDVDQADVEEAPAEEEVEPDQENADDENMDNAEEETMEETNEAEAPEEANNEEEMVDMD